MRKKQQQRQKQQQEHVRKNLGARKKKAAAAAAAAAATDRDWKWLMVMTMILFVYLIRITLHMEKTTAATHKMLNEFIIVVKDEEAEHSTNNDGTKKNKNDDSKKKKEDKIDQQQQQPSMFRDHWTYKMLNNFIIVVEDEEVEHSTTNNGKKKKKEAYQQQQQPSMFRRKWIESAPNLENVTGEEYYRDIPTEFLAATATTNDDFLWDRKKSLVPEWMKDYFRWHRYKRSTWKLENNWKQERFLILECLRTTPKCGGASDRMKTIPTLLKVAYDTKRILLIHWTKPTMLEEFLLPPAGGVDWRVPLVLSRALGGKPYGVLRGPSFRSVSDFAESGVSLVRSTVQSNEPGNIYNTLVFGTNHHEPNGATVEEPDFDTVFAHVWKLLFTPSPPIAQRIQTKLQDMKLRPNKYVAAHVRALYGIADRDTKQVREFALNAVACATQARPKAPIFFSSDSLHATEYALQFGASPTGRERYNLTIVSSPNDPDPPWHLDLSAKKENYDSSSPPSPAMYYDTFIDLYLLALAGCTTYGMGGYGHWGMLIGGNGGCLLRQEFAGLRLRPDKKCEFYSPVPSSSSPVRNSPKEYVHHLKQHEDVIKTVYDDDNGSSLFVPPMKNANDYKLSWA